ILCLHIPPTNYPQTLPWALSGLVNITVNNQLYGNCIVTNSILTAVSGGYPTPANFFTCKLKGGGDTWLLLEDNSGKIRAFNDDGGTTSDGYSWGNASRITTYLTNISAGYVFSYSSNNPVLECDLYMGLAAPTSNIFGTDIYGNGIKFPELNLNNSFVSAPAGNYFCYHWSVGIDYIGPNDDWWIYPTLSPDSIYLWDKFYESYGYTNVGATADNAAIALWMGKYWSIIDADSLNTISHASVRKNSVIPKPHGFEWESKMGGAERIMHTRDAVGGSIYGSIIRYYRPISGTVNYSPPAISAKQKSSFSASDLNRVATLKNQIPVAVLSGFEEKYLAWEKTWSRPEIVIHSNPYRYAESTEYKDLLEYGLKYGKAIWPLLFEKLTPKDIFIVNLLKDLTYGGKRSFGNDITPVPEKGKPLPSAYSILVDYCKGLLAKEEGNMQNAIRNISAAEEGNLEVNISVNDREILLNLSSIIDDKASVTIYNVFGGVEYNASYSLSKGNQTLAINASNFKKGIYIVQITMGGKTISQTISI
ncbi:MAG: T9SS type A sorting domain-containing protein, partial [Candidatus Azobacteroides sp.]|nr:T9SS type A sorting domain-containing protein [Candidatus Azobacteroides sp.]